MFVVPRTFKMSSGFWTGGPKEYRKGLKKQFDARLATLRSRLADATDEEEREAIRLEIKAVQTDYEKKVAEIGKMIF